MKTIEINLLPPEYASEKPYSLRNISFVVLSFLILIFLVMDVYKLIDREKAFNLHNQSIMRVFAQYRPFKQKIDNLRKRAVLLNQRRSELAVLVNQRITWSDKLSQIYMLIPPEVWLSTISIEREISKIPLGRQAGATAKNTPQKEEVKILLHIQGEAEDIGSIGELIRRLATLPYLEKPSFDLINQEQIETRSVMSFTVSAQVNPFQTGVTSPKARVLSGLRSVE